jgi:hypothetical protein
MAQSLERLCAPKCPVSNGQRGHFHHEYIERGERMTSNPRLLYRPRIYYTPQYALVVVKHWDSYVFTFDCSA